MSVDKKQRTGAKTEEFIEIMKSEVLQKDGLRKLDIF